jgi:serine/threonine-protein kinase
MEFLDGSPLNLVLKTYNSIPVQDALPLFIDVCEGLEHAHAQSMIHRDLKPANIMISEDGLHAKILDLGVVKFTDEDNSEQLRLTFAGEIFGSPYYMSPEQSLNKPIDHRSDIYSLGCVLYETLTGVVPFVGYSFVELTNAKMSGKTPSICEKYPHAQFPEALDRMIRQSLSLKPEKRQSSVAEFKQQLKDVYDSLEKHPVAQGSVEAMTFVRSVLEKKT